MQVHSELRFNSVLTHLGDVEYTASGFLEKNQDTILSDLFDLVNRTKARFIKTILGDSSESDSSRKKTLGFQFSSQLNNLMATLESTEPHYVRCIKPNSVKKPGVIDPVLILEQLRYSGIFEACEIRRHGYPFRYSHQSFCTRYKAIAPSLVSSDYRRLAVELISRMGVDPSEIKVGYNLVLYRSEQHRQMEIARFSFLEKVVTVVQKYVRGFLTRKSLRKWFVLRNQVPNVKARRNLAEVDEFLGKLRALRFHCPEINELEILRAHLLREIEIHRVLTALLQRDAEEAYEEYSKAIYEGESIGMSTPLFQTARQKLLSMKDRAQIAKDLKSAIETGDADKLRNTLSQHSKLSLPMTPQVKQAKEFLCVLEAEQSYIEKLKKACSRGGCCKENVIASLELYLRRAGSH
jgi:myosin heavy subunit